MEASASRFVMVRRKSRDAPNALLPGYGDLEEIGGGAFATVFKAVEVETGRPVALKILKVDTIHARLIETFHHEIQALAAVSDHPNIVTLYRPSNTIDGRPVLVLELCRESFGQRLRSHGPIDPVEVTRIGIKIAGALETAHRNGFLHRDMKPQNILVTQFGEPALADFGVAALQASAQLTAGVFGFTTLHAAPEMLEGHHLSPATDIYGLASTMYQLLTGQAPFASYDNEAPASVILRILRDPVRPLRAENVPLDLADLLEAALSKEPEGRPRSALEFAHALQRVEAAQGWVETTFVAWGQEGRQAASMIPARGPMGVATETGSRSDRFATPPAASPASGRPGSGPTSSRYGQPLISSPGVVTPSVERRPSTSVPGAEPAGAEASPGTGGEPGRSGSRSTGGSSLPPLLPPVGPPADPPPPVRPSLSSPEAGTRDVADQVDAVQGRDAAPRPPVRRSEATDRPAQNETAPPDGSEEVARYRPPRPPPRPPYVGFEPSQSPPPSPRPVFVDPDPSEGAFPGSLDEQTMGPHQLMSPPPRPSSPAPAAPSTAAGRIAALPMWAVGALVVAGLVVVAAILLVVGVI
jgi:hypothetical protein